MSHQGEKAVRVDCDECEAEAVAYVRVSRPIFTSDAIPRKLCRPHALDRMAELRRRRYDFTVDGLAQLELFLGL